MESTKCIAASEPMPAVPSSPYRRRSSGSSPRRRRTQAPLTGSKWIFHHLNQWQAPLTLLTWIINLVIFMPSSGNFKLMRWVDASFVLWLQFPKKRTHQFVTHGLQNIWAPILLMETLYVYAYAHRYLAYSHLLLLPLGASYWIVHNRLARAEQRLRVSKGKTISWEEYGCIYLPFALKSGFFSVSAFMNLPFLLRKLVPDLPAWARAGAGAVAHIGMVGLGLSAVLEHNCAATFLFVLWGLHGGASRLPGTVSLPVFFLTFLRAYSSLGAYVRGWALAHSLEGGFCTGYEWLDKVLACADEVSHVLTERLDWLEAFLADSFQLAVTRVHYFQIALYTSIRDWRPLPSSSSSS
ncbi:hypothetical protein Naga_101271g2, partial [Nannochloropsis gaditana]